MCRKIKKLCVAYLMLLVVLKSFGLKVGGESRVTRTEDAKANLDDPGKSGGKYFSLQILSSKCCIHVYTDYKEVLNVETKNNSDTGFTNGLHLVAVNPKSGSVVMKRHFLTEMYGEDIGIPIVLETLRNGEIVILAVKFDAAQNLGGNTRKLFQSLGALEMNSSSLRSYFVWVFLNGGKTLVESVIDDDPALEGNYSASPIYVDVLIQRDNRANCWSGTGNAKDRKREEFCYKYGGYADLCNCNSPLDLNFNVPELKKNAIRNVPILVIASNRPQSLFKCLLTILNQPGGHKENIFVVIDGNHPEVNELLDILDIRYSIHSILIKGLRVGGRISFHYQHAFNLTLHTFRASEFVIVLEEDLLAAPDFVSFLSQSAKILASDKSLYCTNAWNDLSAMHTGGNPHRLMRQETQPSLGSMIKREMLQEALQSWPLKVQNFDWDVWFRGATIKSSRECLVPEISRSFHLGQAGVHANGLFTFSHITGHLTTANKLIHLHNIERLTQVSYEEDLFDLLSSDNVIFLKTALHPCSPHFIERNFTDKVVVLFFRMISAVDKSGWFRLSSCLGLFNMDMRNHHRGMFQFYFYNTKIFAIGYPFSDYSFFKPCSIKPLSAIQDTWDELHLNPLTNMNRGRFIVPHMESLLPFKLPYKKIIKDVFSEIVKEL